MSAKKILLADSDGTVRQQLADTFSTAGYDVEITDSTAQLCRSVLEQHIPVVLLGSGCDKKIAVADLIPLLKKCNRGVTIILVSDEESLPVIRSIRQEGIFYHALKPANQEDTAEILAAVACAFSKGESNDGKQTSPAECREAAPVSEAPCVAGLMTEPVAEENPGSVAYDTSLVTPASGYGRENVRARAAVISTALTAVAGLIYFIYAAAPGEQELGDFMMWCFLGFIALLIVGQLLPVFFNIRAARKVVARQLQEKNDQKQQESAVSDKIK